MKQWSWLEGCFHDRARWRCQSLCAPCVARTWSSRDQGLASIPGWSVMQAFGFIGRSHVLGSITNFLACSTIANACFGNCGWSTLFWFPGAPGRSQSHASEWRKVCRQHAWFCALLDWCVHVGSISSCWFPGAMGVCFVTQPAAAPSAIGPKWCPLPLWQWH